MKLITTISLAALLLPAAAFAKPVLEPKLMGDETFTESFVGIADMADGTYVLAQLGISNAGSGDGNGACRLLVIEKGKKPWTAEKIVKRKGWSYTGGAKEKLQIDSCYLEVGDAMKIVAPLKGGTFELTLHADARKMRFDAHSAKAGSGFYQLEGLIPWAEATLKIGKKGQAVRTVKGYGYSDHSRANALPSKIAKNWVRFRSLSKDAQLVLARIGPNGKASGFVKSQSGTNATINRTQLKKKGKDWQVMIGGQGGPWRLVSKALLHRNAPLEGRGMLGSMLGAVVGNPVTYTYRGVFESKKTKQRISGIIEIAISDE